MIHRFFLLLGLAAMAACSAALIHPGPADAELAATRWPGTTLPELEQARALYVSRCSRCHSLKVPEQYPAARWPDLIGRMEHKAKLTPGETAEITRFLVTTSARVRNEPLPAVAEARARPEP